MNAQARVVALGELLVGKGETATVRNRLLSSASGLIGLRAAFAGVSFLLTVLLARFLGPAAFGIYTYAFAWIVVMCIPAILGMDQLLVREMAALSARSEWASLHGLLRKANGLVTAASMGMALIAGLAVVSNNWN